MKGLHITADLRECRCPPSLLTSASALLSLCTKSVHAVGLTTVADRFHTFPAAMGSDKNGGGVTGVLLLAESHVAIHTWPEYAAITLDVFVCNFTEDNSSKALRLMEDLISSFSPAHCQTHRIERGIG